MTPSLFARTTRVVAAGCVASTLSAAEAQSNHPLGARADSVLLDAERNGFSGVVRIEKDGAVILEKGYGLANRAERVPFTAATVVQIGSCTKDFTTVAVLQLHEEGRLRLQDSISKYFNEVPADKRHITIEQLLRHRAGFPLALGGDFEPVTRAELVRNAMRTPLRFPPGTSEGYSNPGYSLLAAIIEQVTGTTYDVYVRDHILRPLGLTKTGLLLPGFAARDLAHGYRQDGSDAGTMVTKAHASDGPYWNLRGNGGMLSTVAEMATFYRALFGTEKLMRASTRALRFDPNEPVALVGSDNVNFYFYERDPAAGLEMHIASTSQAYKAPAVRRALMQVLATGRTAASGNVPERRVVTETDPARPGTPSGASVDAAVAAIVRDFIATLNRADSSALRAFVDVHFTPSPDGSTSDQRVHRLATMRARAGTLRVTSLTSLENGVHALVSSQSDGTLSMRFELDSGTPPRIRSLRIEARS